MQPVVEQNNWGTPLQQQPYAQPQGTHQQYNYGAMPNQLPKLGKGKRFYPRLKFAKLFMLVIFLLQVLTVYLLINPINLINQLNAVQIVNRVASKVSVPPSEVPQVVARVGDGKTLPSADDLRKENEIQAQVYKDAQNGDYVLLYSSKMIVYREATDTVLYQGDTPTNILQKAQKELMDKVVAKAKAQSIVAASSEETPQLSTITDIAKLKQENAAFYAEGANNDVIALFPTAGKVVLYRPQTDTIVKSGNFKLNIN